MKRKTTLSKSQTNWKRIRAMKDSDIDLSDSPEFTPEMFSRGLVRAGLQPIKRKIQLTVRVDRDVLDWHRSRGRGYQTRINALLRAYMEASKAAVHAR
jgi:uncharacterized protein (DUF4415 family)